MTTHAAPVEAFDLVIFGGTGDLALRKLLPALFHRYADGQIPAGSRVIGVARDALSDVEDRGRVSPPPPELRGEPAAVEEPVEPNPN